MFLFYPLAYLEQDFLRKIVLTFTATLLESRRSSFARFSILTWITTEKDNKKSLH